jgi:ribosomal protein S18 acetylase RimI-like enzyme
MMNSVVRLSAEHMGSAAHTLALAFQNDPLYTYVIPEAKKREKELQWLMQKVVLYTMLYGEVYTTAKFEGVICWLPPGDTELKFTRIVRTGLTAIVFRFGLKAYRRFDENMSFAGELHKRSVRQPHWYLWAIGVAPECWGRGIGGLLMEPVLRSSDAGGIPCYLETHNEKNVAFYLKNGFKVIEEGKAPGHEIRVWAMLRGR